MHKTLMFSLMVAVLFCFAIPLSASECSTCHQAKGVRPADPPAAPIVLRDGSRTETISLAEAFRFHGHECPGMTTTFLALQYGLKLLFGGETPDRKDLMIVSRTPVDGGLDMIDLLMFGKNRKARTSPPEGMQPGRDKFGYTIYRKSNGTAVDVQLKPEHFPGDFYQYKKKQSQKALSEQEWQVLHGYMKDIIVKFPKMSPESLFGKPGPYKAVFWGAPMPAH